ncbi:hypothetical protein DM02DRAFT_296885 [Periconia macrospinosa]|uniref:Uncharacterized protein n=1 Tax=Periconia macrospinosa TaxID=97972 RepID=A0A2V1DZI9_9PLEO|nr:hypothetical protein DM02DRAFT_296885 [Periconia macrospinosa]
MDLIERLGQYFCNMGGARSFCSYFLSLLMSLGMFLYGYYFSFPRGTCGYAIYGLNDFIHSSHMDTHAFLSWALPTRNKAYSIYSATPRRSFSFSSSPSRCCCRQKRLS